VSPPRQTQRRDRAWSDSACDRGGGAKAAMHYSFCSLSEPSGGVVFCGTGRPVGVVRCQTVAILTVISLVMKVITQERSVFSLSNKCVMPSMEKKCFISKFITTLPNLPKAPRYAISIAFARRLFLSMRSSFLERHQLSKNSNHL